ncbi:MAG: hypothetical protein MUP70_01330 [Candidatus Aminicenantes bacterium]|nr:hypothetical protein [Candidatus Aminicenantes bacterium]
MKKITMAGIGIIILVLLTVGMDGYKKADSASTQTRRPVNTVYSVTFRPASPASLMVENNVSVSFNYSVVEPGGARVYIYPHSDGHIVPHRNSAGPLLQGRGSTNGYFTILNGPDLVDGVEMRMYNSDRSLVLFSKIYPVQFQFDVFKVTEVKAYSSSRSFSGRCPHTFNFTGKITVNGAGTVKYKWIRSDGATSRPDTIIFRTAGTQTVSTSWTLGSDGQEYKDYWEAVEIIEPNPITSNKALFTLICNR